MVAIYTPLCSLQLALGVGVAATVRVGNELGAGNSTAAKRAAYISLALGGESVTLKLKDNIRL